MTDEIKKDYKGKDPVSPEKIVSDEPTAVSRDPEDIKEGIAETKEESRERLRRSGMTREQIKLNSKIFNSIIPLGILLYSYFFLYTI
jgi:hypothetical protein